MANTDLLQFGIYCETEEQYTYGWSPKNDPPTQCYNNPAHTVIPTSVMTYNIDTDDTKFYYSDVTAPAGTCVSISPQTGKAVAGYGNPSTKFNFATTAGFTATCTMNSTQSIVVYSNSLTSSYGFAVVCTTNGNTMTYGTPVKFSGTDVVLQSMDICAADAGTAVVVWRTTTALRCVFLGLSGTGENGTVSVGTIMTAVSASTGDIVGSIKACIANGYLAITYRLASGGRGYVQIGYFASLLGIATVVTFLGSPRIFGAAAIAPQQYSLAIAPIDANKFLIVFDQSGLKCCVCTVSGLLVLTTATFGTITSAIDIENVPISVRDISTTLTNTNQALIVYRRTTDNVTVGRAVGVTISGTNVTVGTPISYTTATGIQNPNLVKIDNNQAACVYLNGNDNLSGNIAVLSQSGTDVSVTSTDTMFAASAQYMCASFVNNAVLCHYRDITYNSTGSGSLFTVVSGEPVLSTTKGSKPIGLLAEDSTAGSVAIVKLYGSLEIPSGGLLVGRTYYSNGDGALTLSYIPGDNSYIPVKVGTAVRTNILAINI